MRPPRVLAVCGPSGAGKTTAVRLLCERDPSVVRIVTATTRPRRPGEVDGYDYLFLSPSTFERAVEEGALAAPTRYDGHRYGVPLSPIIEAFAARKDVAVVVDPAGASALGRAFPDRVLPVLLDPPQGLAAARLRRREGAGAGTSARTAAMPEERRIALEMGCRPLWDEDILTTVRMLGSVLRGT